CKTIWRVLKRNNQTESTDAATHSCRVEFSDESMLRENSMDGVLQQNREQSGYHFEGVGSPARLCVDRVD
ncbi:MAG: hypothetical protein VB959_08930, partial [Rhodospirillales bacterium]